MVVKEGNRLDLGSGVSWTVYDTPGHSPCHISLHNEREGTLVIGDATGFYVPEKDIFWPNYFNSLEAYCDSIRKREAQFGPPIYIISDEAYRRLVYDGIKFPFPLQHHANCITIASHSKDLSLPGERIGYIAVHPECADHEDLLNGLTFCTRALGFVNAPALMQNLLRHLQGVSVSIAEYQKKRDLIYNALSEMGYSIVKPRGAFYVFPRTPIADDVAFVEEMLEHLVLVVPGSGFGLPSHFRASFCVDNDTIESSLNAFSKLARKYRIG